MIDLALHTHDWVRDDKRNRYQCACGVVGHKASNLPGQYRATTKYIKPFRCMHRTGGRYCSAEAVFVTADRQQSRCGQHAVRKSA